MEGVGCGVYCYKKQGVPQNLVCNVHIAMYRKLWTLTRSSGGWGRGGVNLEHSRLLTPTGNSYHSMILYRYWIGTRTQINQPDPLENENVKI